MGGPSILNGLVVAGGVLAFMPYFQLRVSNLDIDHDGDGRRLYGPPSAGSWFHAASLVALTLVAPILLDLVADYITSKSKTSHGNSKEATETSRHVDIVSDTEKAVLSVGFLVFPMVAFFPSTVPHMELLTVCALRAQVMLVGGTMFTSLIRQARWHIPAPVTVTLLLVFVAATVLAGYASNAGAAGDGVPSRQPLCVADAVLLCVCGAALLVACGLWLRTLIGTKWPGARRVNPAASAAAAAATSAAARKGSPKDATAAPDVYTSSRILFVVSVVVWVGIRIAGAVVYSDSWPTVGDDVLFLTLVPTIIFELGILMIRCALARLEMRRVRGGPLISRHTNPQLARGQAPGRFGTHRPHRGQTGVRALHQPRAANAAECRPQRHTASVRRSFGGSYQPPCIHVTCDM